MPLHRCPPEIYSCPTITSPARNSNPNRVARALTMNAISSSVEWSCLAKRATPVRTRDAGNTKIARCGSAPERIRHVKAATLRR